MTGNDYKKDKEYIKGRMPIKRPGLTILSALLVFTMTVGIFLVMPAPIEAITLKGTWKRYSKT